MTQDPWLSPEQQWQAPGGGPSGASGAVPGSFAGAGSASGSAETAASGLVPPQSGPQPLAPSGPQPGAPVTAPGFALAAPPPYGVHPAPPGYPGFPGYAKPPRPPQPLGVKLSVGFSIAGIVLSVLTMIVTYASMDSIEAHILTRTYSEAEYVSARDGIYFFGFAVGILGAGLWIWITVMCALGRHWARVTGSVFFALGCLMWVLSLTDGTIPGSAKLLLAATFFAALPALITLWRPDSNAYFRPAGVGAPAYPATYPGQYPYPGQPLPGAPRHLQGQPVEPGYQQGGWPGQYGQQPPDGQGPQGLS